MGGSAALLTPYIRQFDRTSFEKDAESTFTVYGENFTVRTDVKFVNSNGDFYSPTHISRISPQEMRITFIPTVSETLSLILSHSEGTKSNYWESNIGHEAIKVKDKLWIDLRLGGDVLTANVDYALVPGMSMTRTSQGMTFQGMNPWSARVTFPCVSWNRDVNFTASMVVKFSTSAAMHGVGSTAMAESSTSQYGQGETLLYVNGSGSIYGFYGNNGNIGSAVSCSNSGTFNSTKFHRIDIINDNTFEVYELPSGNPEDWDDSSNLKYRQTSCLTPDKQNLMLMVIPVQNTTIVVAVGER